MIEKSGGGKNNLKGREDEMKRGKDRDTLLAGMVDRLLEDSYFRFFVSGSRMSCCSSGGCTLIAPF